MTLRLVIALAGIVSLPALAGGHPDRPRLDTNGDGAVDLAEIQARHPDFTVEKFNAADADRNGQLSREELHGAFRKHHDRARLDTDGDGSLTLAEMQKAHPDLSQEKFAAYDGDQDGKLTRGELKQGFGREMFKRLDKDADGGVSLAEMQSFRSSVTPEKFSRMDQDGSGLLSPDELRAAHRHRHRDGEPPAAPVTPPQP